MNVFLFTFHGYATWMPDHPQGFTKPKEGLLPPDASLAEQYRVESQSDRVTFVEPIQLLLIDETRIAATKQIFRPLFIATESIHAHVLIRWEDERPWMKVRSGIKQSFSRRLGRELGKRNWLSERASRRDVTDDNHFVYLVHEYLPSHRGWKWCERRGLFR
jgi:hypothetical protein